MVVAKRTRKREFLERMDHVLPWDAMVKITAPNCPVAKTGRGRPGLPVELLLRVHCLQQWLGLSDQAMEEALVDGPLYREFAKLHESPQRIPTASAIRRFRLLLDESGLAPELQHIINDILGHRGLRLRPGHSVGATLVSVPRQ
jgi:IS5 family transposase